MIRERPWTGFGLGTWRVVYPAYATFDNGLTANQAHNDWAEWTAEGGAGLALVLLAVACWSAARALRHPWAVGVAAVFLHSLVDYPLREPALAACLFSLLGALAAAVAGARRTVAVSPGRARDTSAQTAAI
jgi:O-antigen ligase